VLDEEKPTIYIYIVGVRTRIRVKFGFYYLYNSEKQINPYFVLKIF
jgi:hypothetical protein